MICESWNSCFLSSWPLRNCGAVYKEKTAKIRAEGRRAKVTAHRPPDFQKSVCGIYVVKRKITAVFTAVILYLVDPKGIEPSNLTDANRALSQLSYGPKSALFLRKKLRILDFSIFSF